MNYPALLTTIDDWFADGVKAAHGAVLCRRGCSACCHGPFDISAADAELVAAAVSALDAATRSTVQSRAIAQIDACTRLRPEWSSPWRVDDPADAAFDALADALAALPCPALGDDGACVIYASRPATCRMTGLAMCTPQGDRIDNVCPILHTSDDYAALPATCFNLREFEDLASTEDRRAEADGWCPTTVAGAIARMN